MNSMQPENRKKVTVNPHLADKLQEKAEQFDKLWKKEQDQFNQSNNMCYYLVSTRYLQQWNQYCKGKEQLRYKPQIMNFDLIAENGQLRAGLLENTNFYILGEEIYKIIKDEHSKYELKRNAIKNGKEKIVPIYLEKIQYVKITQEDLKKVSAPPPMKKIEIWKQDNIKNLMSYIKLAQNIDLKKEIKIWRSKNEQFKDAWNELKKEFREESNVCGRGSFLHQLNQKIQDLMLAENDYFIVEVPDKEKNWVFSTPKSGCCQWCHSKRIMRVECRCTQVAYCNKECQERDKRFHKNHCRFLQEEQENQQLKMSLTSSSLKGKVGLHNLGNTCFMNSCLQCLSNTLPLTQYFLDGLFEGEINFENKLGSGGRIAKKYARFIYNMWCGSSSTYAPSQLKSAVGKKNSMFMGYGQHDSHQFFSSIVDFIHEDLNRVKHKQLVEQVESKERDDKIVAFESWIAYLKRNQSIIVDLMTGQYKSKVVCPKCKLQSITFDPFTTVSLPLQNQSECLKFFVIYSNCRKKAEELMIRYSQFDNKKLLESATELLNRKPSQFIFYILTQSQDIYNFQNTQSQTILGQLQDNEKAFLLQLTPQQQQMKQKIQIVTQFSKQNYGNLWLKRPFFFSKNSTVKTIRKRINEQLQNIDKSNGLSEKQKSLFTLYFRYGKYKQSRYFGKSQTKFKGKLLLDDDQVRLENILNENKQSEIELVVQFKSVKLFDFDKWKQYDPKYKKNSRMDDQDDSPIMLDQCFNYFKQPQKLLPGNQWYCSNCKQHQLATKQMNIYKAPQILILHLKRFKSSGKYFRDKDGRSVKFPPTLNLKPFVIDQRPMSSYMEQLIKQKQPFYVKPPYTLDSSQTHCQYKLYAISNHFGGLGGGHYTAFAKNEGRWFEFNDSSVRETNQGHIQGSAAYLLFYRRAKK